jgi:hypothetical protein
MANGYKASSTRAINPQQPRATQEAMLLYGLVWAREKSGMMFLVLYM